MFRMRVCTKKLAAALLESFTLDTRACCVACLLRIARSPLVISRWTVLNNNNR